MIVVDTSALIDSLTGPKRSAHRLRTLIEEGHRLLLPTLVLYEWLRGPRLAAEIELQERLFPPESTLDFGSSEASIAADLYGRLDRPRGREIDLAIAAHALIHGAPIWTLNQQDFADIPSLRVL